MGVQKTYVLDVPDYNRIIFSQHECYFSICLYNFQNNTLIFYHVITIINAQGF